MALRAATDFQETMILKIAALAFTLSVMVLEVAQASTVPEGIAWSDRNDTAAPMLAQPEDLPDVVHLLVQRAVRAERRGDFATADELYETLRSLGYVVRRQPRPKEMDRHGTATSSSLMTDDYHYDYDDEDDDDGDNDRDYGGSGGESDDGDN